VRQSWDGCRVALLLEPHEPFTHFLAIRSAFWLDTSYRAELAEIWHCKEELWVFLPIADLGRLLPLRHGVLASCLGSRLGPLSVTSAMGECGCDHLEILSDYHPQGFVLHPALQHLRITPNDLGTTGTYPVRFTIAGTAYLGYLPHAKGFTVTRMAQTDSILLRIQTETKLQKSLGSSSIAAIPAPTRFTCVARSARGSLCWTKSALRK
jgi:hypothetical protein